MADNKAGLDRKVGKVASADREDLVSRDNKDVLVNRGDLVVKVALVAKA